MDIEKGGFWEFEKRGHLSSTAGAQPEREKGGTRRRLHYRPCKQSKEEKYIKRT